MRRTGRAGELRPKLSVRRFVIEAPVSLRFVGDGHNVRVETEGPAGQDIGQTMRHRNSASDAQAL